MSELTSEDFPVCCGRDVQVRRVFDRTEDSFRNFVGERLVLRCTDKTVRYECAKCGKELMPTRSAALRGEEETK